MENQLKFIKINLKSYDSKSIFKTIASVKDAAFSAGVSKVTVVHLPKKEKRFVLNRSPHVYSTSKEKFKLVTHSCFVKISIDNDNVVANLSKIKIDSAVHAKISVI